MESSGGEGWRTEGPTAVQKRLSSVVRRLVAADGERLSLVHTREVPGSIPGAPIVPSHRFAARFRRVALAFLLGPRPSAADWRRACRALRSASSVCGAAPRRKTAVVAA